MINNKGSAIILVLEVTSLVLILGTVLLNITYIESAMSSMYENIVSVQYISEAGIGRAVSIISKNIKDRIETVLAEARVMGSELCIQDSRPAAESIKLQLENYILNEVNCQIVDYFKDKTPGGDCFNEDIKMYQENDSMFLTDENGVESYYTLSASLHGNVSDRIVVIESVGHLRDAVKTIIAFYKIEDVEIVDVGFPTNSDALIEASENSGDGDMEVKIELLSYKLSCERWVE